MSQPKKALKASNQNADMDSYLPSENSPGRGLLALVPLPFARKTARCDPDDGVYGSLGCGAYT